MPDERIDRIPEGVAPAYRPLSPDDPPLAEALARLGLRPGYVLFVGTIEPRKNLATLLQAHRLLTRRHDILLVVAGRPGWRARNLSDSSTGWG